jgi:hypothetical protein
VPIFRSTREFSRSNISCSRTQFPVTIAYAMTIHKSQGITVPRAVLNISDRDFASGLTYVAISRVKSLAGLLFEEPFDFERFTVARTETMEMRMADAARRASEHVGLCLHCISALLTDGNYRYSTDPTIQPRKTYLPPLCGRGTCRFAHPRPFGHRPQSLSCPRTRGLIRRNLYRGRARGTRIHDCHSDVTNRIGAFAIRISCKSAAFRSDQSPD